MMDRVNEVEPTLAVGYQHYLADFLKFIAQIELAALPPVSPSARVIGFVITPWLLTPVPFYVLTLALLVRKKGVPILLIWDDLTPQWTDAATAMENEAIATVKAALPANIPGIDWTPRCSELPETPLNDADQAEVARLGQLNAFWQLQTTVLREEVQAYQDDYAQRLQRNLPKIKSLFADLPVDTLLVPGGIYGNSGLFYWCGRHHSVRVASFDVGFSEELWFGFESVACHLMDVAQAVLSADSLLTPEQQTAAIQVAKYDFLQRMEGKDKLQSQVVAGSAAPPVEPWDIIIPLNVDFDSAALGQSGLFTGSYEWLMATIDFILNQTQASVLVRQHPIERVWGGTDWMPVELIKSFGGHPRFRFVSAWEQVNTYNLIRHAKLVLPFTSTVGIEAAVLGKPVLMSREAYYANLPFVVKAVSQLDYFSKIRAFLETPYQPTPEVIETAWLAYFFSQVCYMLQTPMTTYPADFHRWVRQTLDELLAEPEVQVVLQSLIEGIPTITLQYQRLLAERSSALKRQKIDATQLWQTFEDRFRVNPSPQTSQAVMPQPVPAPYRQFLSYFNSGNTLDALQCLQSMPDPITGLGEMEYIQAIALARLNQTTESMALLQSVLKQTPGHTRAQELLLELQALGKRSK